jgi:hypothetical protein
VRVTAAKQEANVRHGSVVAKPNQKYGVVVGRFNDLVTKLLLEGAYGAFESHGVSLSNVEVRMQQQCSVDANNTSRPELDVLFASCASCERNSTAIDLLAWRHLSGLPLRSASRATVLVCSSVAA